jgi:hypothetical protein
MIWTSVPSKSGQRVMVLAQSLRDAREKLEAEYGEGSVFDLRLEEDPARLR